MAAQMSPERQTVLDAFLGLCAEDPDGIPPSVREIALRVGRSSSTVYAAMQKLAALGYVVYRPGRSLGLPAHAQSGMTAAPLLDLMEARAARDEGLARADDHADILWREAVDRIIARLARLGDPFTNDDVRALAPSPPPGFSPNCWGPRLLAAAKTGLILRQVGHAVSRQRQGHANRVVLWRGC